MKFSLKSAPLPSIATPCLVAGVFENGALSSHAAALDKAAGGAIGKIVKQGDIDGKAGQHLLLHNLPGIKASRVLLLGCGKREEVDARKFAAVLQNAARTLEKYRLGDALLALDDIEGKSGIERKARLAAQILANAAYRYGRTKSKPVPASRLKSVDLYLADKSAQAAARRGLDTGRAIARGMTLARELGDLPANICTPGYLAEQAEELAKNNANLKVRSLNETQMKRLGMGALLSVSAGSAEPAKLVILEYSNGPANAKPHVLVGKGITFDTGGISIKPGAAMDEMKFDMCGAASVLGVMAALGELQPKLNVVGLIASAENMPSGTATKPGDIVTSMSGQTIEILNTDAEGRLVLCDALTYAERYEPASVIDVATLTGACIVALGAHVSGLMSNDDQLAETLYQCGQTALDPVWRLPLWDEYQKQLNSNFADIANIGGPKAGTITAACFLSRFTKKFKWAHLDIAGTAWVQGEQKGATGRPVPLLMEYLLNC